MQSSNRFPLYFIKDLKIYTLVDEEDIPSIIDYFQCYNIADIDNVSFDKEKKHLSIKVKEYYKNNISQKFYEDIQYFGFHKILRSNCYKVWYIEFDASTYPSNLHLDIKEIKTEEDYSQTELQESREVLNSADEEFEEDNVHENNENNENNEDNVDVKDYDSVALKFNNMVTRYKNKYKGNTNRKSSNSDENITLEDLLVKKNKNYMKNDKRKSYKNVWSRRLRQKLNSGLN